MPASMMWALKMRQSRLSKDHQIAGLIEPIWRKVQHDFDIGRRIEAAEMFSHGDGSVRASVSSIPGREASTRAGT